MKNSGNILIAILAAATAGVVIGMLIAPEKGEDLRKNIKDVAGDWTKKLAKLMAEGKVQFDDHATSIGESVTDLANKVKK